MDYFPSKSFAIRALLILAIIAGWFLFLKPEEKSSGAETNAETASLVQSEETPEIQPSETVSDPSLTKDAYLGLSESTLGPTAFKVQEGTAKPEEMQAYGEGLRKALAPYADPTRKNEVAVMLSAIKKKTLAEAELELGTLEIASVSHTAVRDRLRALAVPELFAPFHEELIVGTGRLAQITKNMSNAFEDPLRALASAEEYANESARIKAGLSGIDLLFTQNNITFKEKVRVVLYETE